MKEYKIVLSEEEAKKGCIKILEDRKLVHPIRLSLPSEVENGKKIEVANAQIRDRTGEVQTIPILVKILVGYPKPSRLIYILLSCGVIAIICIGFYIFNSNKTSMGAVSSDNNSLQIAEANHYDDQVAINTQNDILSIIEDDNQLNTIDGDSDNEQSETQNNAVTLNKEYLKSFKTYIGKWYFNPISNDTFEQELSLESVDDDKIVFSLSYYQTTEFNNIIARLNDDYTADFEDGGISGSINFLNNSIVVSVEQSTNESVELKTDVYFPKELVEEQILPQMQVSSMD